MAGEIQPFELQDIDRFVPFVNPASEHHLRITEQITTIQTATGLRPEHVYSSANPQETQDNLRIEVLPKLNAGTLFVVFGGDGLANEAVNVLAGDNSTEDSREAPVLFSDNGTASDTALGLFSAKDLKHLGELLTRKDLVTADAYPLEVEFEGPKGRKEKIVNSYFGVGASPEGAFALNRAKPKFRRWRENHPRLGSLWQKARELDIVTRACLASPRFDVAEKNWPHHHLTYERAIELLIGNGSRMAKYGRWPLTGLLRKDVEIAVRTSHFDGLLRTPTVLANGFRMTFGQLGTEYDDGFEKPDYRRAWDIKNIQRTKKDRPLLVQFDGETTEIEEGKLTASRAPAIRVLTRKALAKSVSAIAA